MNSEDFTHGIRTLTLGGWEAFSEALQGRNPYVWRGQRREDWPLLSAFDRSFPADAPYNEREAKAYEHLERFRYLMRGQLDESLELALSRRRQDNDWWAQGQQHGLNTPLLSWTASPYVALYFAVRHFWKFDDGRGSFVCIWGLPPLDHINVRLRSHILEHDPERYAQQCTRTCVDAFYPYQAITCRLTSQSAFFTKTPYGTALEDWLAANGCEDDENLVRIRIPFTRGSAQDCLRHLTRMNINPLTLWPAREGACLLANTAMQIEDYHTFW